MAEENTSATAAPDTGNQSLMTAWRAAEAAAGGPEEAPAGLPSEADSAADATEAKIATVADTKKAPAAKAAADVAETGDAAELAQLKALSDKLKYKVEDGRVTVAERYNFREERRQANERIAKLEADLKAGDAKSRAELDPFLKAAEAFDANDLDGFAKALAARKGMNWAGWQDLQKHVLNSLADPNYREVQELKRQVKEREEREQRDLETRRQTEANREKMEAIANYKRGLGQELAGSADPFVKAMASDPMFVDFVWRIQEQHYDPANNSTVTPEEAVELGIKGSKNSFRGEMKELFERLKVAFGETEAAAPAAKVAPAKVGKTGKAKTEAEAPHVGKPGGVGFMDPKDREYWARQLIASRDD